MLDDINRERYTELSLDADFLHIKTTSLQHEVTEATKAFANGRNVLSTYEHISICNEIVLQRKMILSIQSEIRILRDEAHAISVSSP